MKVNKKDIKNMINLANDMLNVFNDYCCVLDDYFSLEKNKLDHNELYLEYRSLSINLKIVMKKNGFDVK